MFGLQKKKSIEFVTIPVVGTIIRKSEVLEAQYLSASDSVIDGVDIKPRIVVRTRSSHIGPIYFDSEEEAAAALRVIGKQLGARTIPHTGDRG